MKIPVVIDSVTEFEECWQFSYTQIRTADSTDGFINNNTAPVSLRKVHRDSPCPFKVGQRLFITFGE